ncbi:hypothetical protein [Tautonia marina]|uniref:hypothetical protein n=1 Tax=Tautonia marina TaxID=2653855 RepID=UPI001260E971|nr:hypothetical protein [Tautonia marina]
MVFGFTLFQIVLGGLAAIGAASLGVWLVEQFRLEPPPKPKEWTLQFKAPDGYPMRSYTLDDKEVYRLMNQLHHDYYHK